MCNLSNSNKKVKVKIESHSCWGCENNVTKGEGVCSVCDKVQPLFSLNPFQALGVLETMDLDLAELDKAYFNKQRALHPDKFINKTPKEQMYALQHTSRLNDAYLELKKTSKRAFALLKLKGGKSLKETEVPPEIAAKQFELRERLMDGEAVDDLLKEVQKSIKLTIENFTVLLEELKLDDAALKAVELRFLEALEEELKRRR